MANGTEKVGLFSAGSGYTSKALNNGADKYKKREEHKDPQVAYASQVLPGLLSNPSSSQQTASAFVG